MKLVYLFLQVPTNGFQIDEGGNFEGTEDSGVSDSGKLE